MRNPQSNGHPSVYITALSSLIMCDWFPVLSHRTAIKILINWGFLMWQVDLGQDTFNEIWSFQIKMIVIGNLHNRNSVLTQINYNRKSVHVNDTDCFKWRVLIGTKCGAKPCILSTNYYFYPVWYSCKLLL